MITSDGTVGLPLIGNINLDDLTISQAQQKISNAYATYINNPNATVQLVSAQSLRYYLLGAFSSPGVISGSCSTLLDALSLGGTVELSNADLYQAYVVQGSRKCPWIFMPFWWTVICRRIHAEFRRYDRYPPSIHRECFCFWFRRKTWDRLCSNPGSCLFYKP